MSEQETAFKGIGLGTIVFVVFLVLKLAGIGEVATWSWWWVTSPLWIPWAIVGIIGGIAILVALILSKIQ